MDTEHRDAFYGRGWTLRANGRSDLAAREFEQAIGVDPTHARSFAGLALCLSDVASHQRAVEAARTGLTLDPSDAFVRRAMGWALLGTGRPADAVSHAFESLKIEPSAYDGHVLLGEACFQSRDYAVALKAGANAIRLRPDEAGGHRLKSSALRALSRLDESRAAAETALRIEPDSFWSHIVLARVAITQRDGETAAAAYREALRLKPSSDEARQGLVRALKMRNFMYRWVTRFHVWFFRLPAVPRVALVIGVTMSTAGFGALIVVPVVLAGRMADPVADLVLRFDRYGRALLTRKQIVGKDQFAMIVLGIAGLGIGVALRRNVQTTIDVVFSAASIPAVFSAFGCRPGKPREWMLAYMIVLSGLIATAHVWAVQTPTGDVVGVAALLDVAAFAGLLASARVARHCGYPWSHRFDAPSR